MLSTKLEDGPGINFKIGRTKENSSLSQLCAPKTGPWSLMTYRTIPDAGLEGAG